MSRIFCVLILTHSFLYGFVKEGVGTFVEKAPTPKFSDLERYYPVPARFRLRYKGGLSDHDLISMTGFKEVQNVENLRLSRSLNYIGGVHLIVPDIGDEFVDQGRKLILPRYAVEHDPKTNLFYILSDFEMGPYLANKYGTPRQRHINAFESRLDIEASLSGLKGIIRFIMRNGSLAHVGLWECNRVLYTFDYLYEKDLERVELWPAEDSHCE